MLVMIRMAIDRRTIHGALARGQCVLPRAMHDLLVVLGSIGLQLTPLGHKHTNERIQDEYDDKAYDNDGILNEPYVGKVGDRDDLVVRKAVKRGHPNSCVVLVHGRIEVSCGGV